MQTMYAVGNKKGFDFAFAANFLSIAENLPVTIVAGTTQDGLFDNAVYTPASDGFAGSWTTQTGMVWHLSQDEQDALDADAAQAIYNDVVQAEEEAFAE